MQRNGDTYQSVFFRGPLQQEMVDVVGFVTGNGKPGDIIHVHRRYCYQNSLFSLFPKATSSSYELTDVLAAGDDP